METLLLSQSEVRAVLTMESAIEAVERAFHLHATEKTQMPSKVYLNLSEHNGDFRAMPAYSEGSAGVKWINAHPDNPKRFGLPTVRGVYILSDPETANALAVMDATWLTAVRTGASAGVASKHLARPDVRSIGFIGSGVQARCLLAAHWALFDDLQIVACDARPEAAQEFADEVGGRTGTPEEVARCDIVCTATPSRSPVLMRDWVGPGTHINAMGADAAGKQELDPALLRAAKVVVDDYAQASGGGEVNVPLRSGEFDHGELHASIGEVIAGARPGRTGAEITVFDSTGLAIQDVAVARLVYEEARLRGIGRELDFFG